MAATGTSILCPAPPLAKLSRTSDLKSDWWHCDADYFDPFRRIALHHCSVWRRRELQFCVQHRRWRNCRGLQISSLTGGTATLTTSTLSVGSHSITAAYGGDGNFNSVSSTAAGETVEDFRSQV